jgi:uncharacterized membrane protein
MGTTLTAQEYTVREPERAPRWERSDRVNIGRVQRIVSTAAGSLLALYGIRRADVPGLLMATGGGVLLHRGATGHCMLLGSLGVSTTGNEWLQLAPRRGRHAEVSRRRAVRVEREVTIDKPIHEVYSFWRDVRNLPRAFRHVLAVSPIDERRSRWTAKAPGGTSVIWNAEIYNDVPDQMIAWRSIEPAAVPNSGAVSFAAAPGGRGTEVRVSLQYEPPLGRAGRLAARLFGEEPEQQVREDLRHLKQVLEAGEIPTIEGQPEGER